MVSTPFEPFTYLTSHPQGLHHGIVEPTPEFVREVGDMLRDPQDDRAVARWIVERIEEYGAQFARPVFDMQGNGPSCSYCGSIACLCGHPDRSLIVEDSETFS